MTLTDRDSVRHSNRQYRSACVYGDDVLPLIKTVLIRRLMRMAATAFLRPLTTPPNPLYILYTILAIASFSIN